MGRIARALFITALLAGCKKPAPPVPPHKMGDSYPTNLAGDVVGPPQANVVTNIDGKTLPVPSGTNTALVYNGTSLVWSNPVVDGGGGMNQLTGQVTAGPGSSSQAATVVIPQANQLFIANNGSDSNPCNLANPCATYAHTAAAAVTAGATATNLYAIIYGPGKFSENIAFVSGTVVVGSVGFDQPLTSFTGSIFTLGTSFTGSGLAGSGVSAVTFAPTGSFAFDLNFVGQLSTNSFFDISNSTLSGTLTVEGYTGTTVQIYQSYGVSFTITNAGTFTSWNNEMVGPLTTNCTTGACGWQSQNDAIVGNVLLEGSQANTTTFENVGFRGGLTLNGTASTFAGDIGSIPTAGVTYAASATPAQYVISGLLPVTNIAPSDGGGILVLTSDGGTVYWSSGAVDGGGITQLTGPVTAGPGTGSQATAINFGGGSLSGKVPIANVAACTSAQILESNATPTQTCTSVTGDVSLSATGVTTVTALQSNAVASGALVKGDALFATSTSTWAEAAFGGDLTCSTVTPGSCTLGSIDGKSLPTPPSTGTTVLTDTTGSLSWSSGSGTSVTGTGIWYSASGTLNSAAVQCTGDVTCAGALSSGNLPFVVADIHGASVPVAGSLTTGNVLQVSAASVDTYGPVNLAGGANFVSGNLPTGNFAPGTSAQVLMSNATPSTTWTTVTGDTTISATGVTTTAKVNGVSISGTPASGNVPIASSSTAATWGEMAAADFTPGTSAQILMSNATPSTTWTTMSQDATISATGAVTVAQLQDATITISNNAGNVQWWTGGSPELSQASVSTATGTNTLIQPQQSTNTNATGGSLLVNLEAPTGTGSESYLQLQRGGTTQLWMGGMPGNAGFEMISFTSPNSSGTNVALFGSGGTTFLNSIVQLDFAIAGTQYGEWSTGGLQVAKTATDFGGGVGVIGLGVAGTNPTTAPSTSGDSVLYSTTSGLFADLTSVGTNFVTQQLLPVFAGTQNSQNRTFLQLGGFARSTSTANVTCVTIPIPSNTCAYAVTYAVGRISSTNATGFLHSDFSCNNGTTVSTTSANVASPSLGTGGGAVTSTASGSNVLFQVNSGATTTDDWQCQTSVSIN